MIWPAWSRRNPGPNANGVLANKSVCEELCGMLSIVEESIKCPARMSQVIFVCVLSHTARTCLSAPTPAAADSLPPVNRPSAAGSRARRVLPTAVRPRNGRRRRPGRCGSFSKAIQRRSSFSAALPVVLEPAKMSSTVSPGSVRNSMKNVGNFSGKRAGWGFTPTLAQWRW